MNAKLLLVDDEPAVLAWIKGHLEHEGYDVVTAQNYEEGLYLLEISAPDLIILDIRFEPNDRLGLVLLKHIRHGLEDKTTPVIMLTGVSEDELEPLSFDLGATDFVRKSVSPRALLARIRARLQPSGEIIAVDDQLRVDIANASIKIKLKKRWDEVHLEPKEWDLLKKLIRNPGRVILRSTLEAIFIDADDPSRALNTCVSKLRNLLEPDPRNPKFILTKRGIGYMFIDYR